ncbi:hypothetical protein N325_07192, partial [Colius striatus]
WEVPAMAFLIELLACPDMRTWDEQILQLFSRYLQCKSRAMHHLVLKGLINLCEKSSMGIRMQNLQQRLIELLDDADGELVGVTLAVLRKMLRAIDTPICSTIALELAERLRSLFDRDTSLVQLLSLHLFQDVMEFASKEGKKLLKEQVRQSLLPLLCLLHEE